MWLASHLSKKLPLRWERKDYENFCLRNRYRSYGGRVKNANGKLKNKRLVIFLHCKHEIKICGCFPALV